MKIRTDFVTNSSSSSYVTIHFKKKNGEEIECTSAIDDNGFNEALALKFQDELDELVISTEGSGAALMKTLDELYNGLLLACVDCDRTNVDAIQAIKGFDELTEIVLIDRYSSGEPDSIEITYCYDVNSGKSQMVVEDCDESMSFLDELGDSSFDLNQNPNDLTAVVEQLTEEEIELSGTQYEGRSDRIEHVKIGDKLKLVREPNNAYDKNAIDVQNASGSLGHLPSHIVEQLSPLMDLGLVTCTATVSEVLPLSKRGGRAKKAILKVRLNYSLIEKI